MQAAKRRLLLYGSGVCLAGALLFVGFVYKPPADISQLLKGASFQIKMGAYDAARKTLSEVFERDRANWKAMWMEAYLSERQGIKTRALFFYRLTLEVAEGPEFLPSHRQEIEAEIARLEGATEKAPKTPEKAESR